jgi:hypothetical protein
MKTHKIGRTTEGETETSRGPTYFKVSASAPSKETRMQCRPNNSEYVNPNPPPKKSEGGGAVRLPIQINTPA